MANTIRDRLLRAIKARFEAGQGGTTFSYVEFEDWTGRRLRGQNALQIVEGLETYAETMGAKALDRTIEVELRTSLLIPRDQAPTEVTRRVLGDIEKIVMEDVTWGGLAMTTRLQSNLQTLDDSSDRIVELSVAISVQYRTRRLDPET